MTLELQQLVFALAVQLKLIHAGQGCTLEKGVELEFDLEFDLEFTLWF